MESGDFSLKHYLHVHGDFYPLRIRFVGWLDENKIKRKLTGPRRFLEMKKDDFRRPKGKV